MSAADCELLLTNYFDFDFDFETPYVDRLLIFLETATRWLRLRYIRHVPEDVTSRIIKNMVKAVDALAKAPNIDSSPGRLLYRRQAFPAGDEQVQDDHLHLLWQLAAEREALLSMHGTSYVRLLHSLEVAYKHKALLGAHGALAKNLHAQLLYAHDSSGNRTCPIDGNCIWNWHGVSTCVAVETKDYTRCPLLPRVEKKVLAKERWERLRRAVVQAKVINKMARATRNRNVAASEPPRNGLTESLSVPIHSVPPPAATLDTLQTGQPPLARVDSRQMPLRVFDILLRKGSRRPDHAEPLTPMQSLDPGIPHAHAPAQLPVGTGGTLRPTLARSKSSQSYAGSTQGLQSTREPPSTARRLLQSITPNSWAGAAPNPPHITLDSQSSTGAAVSETPGRSEAHPLLPIVQQSPSSQSATSAHPAARTAASSSPVPPLPPPPPQLPEGPGLASVSEETRIAGGPPLVEEPIPASVPLARDETSLGGSSPPVRDSARLFNQVDPGLGGTFDSVTMQHHDGVRMQVDGEDIDHYGTFSGVQSDPDSQANGSGAASFSGSGNGNQLSAAHSERAVAGDEE